MKLNNNIIQLAKITANNSTYHQKVGCVIFTKKQIISVDHNYHLRSAKKLHPKYQKWEGSVHAEIACILKARTDLKSTSMLVVRINNNNELRLAKPCEHCMKYIYHVQIKNLFYSINNDILHEVL